MSRDSMRLHGTDTVGIPGRADQDSSGALGASVSQPAKQPGQSTSRTGDSASSTGP